MLPHYLGRGAEQSRQLDELDQRPTTPYVCCRTTLVNSINVPPHLVYVAALPWSRRRAVASARRTRPPSHHTLCMLLHYLGRREELDHRPTTPCVCCRTTLVGAEQSRQLDELDQRPRLDAPEQRRNAHAEPTCTRRSRLNLGTHHPCLRAVLIDRHREMDAILD